MAKQLPRVIIVGSLNMDMVTVTSRIPSGGETIMAKSFSTGCGGKGANQAVAAARLAHSDSGVELASVSMIGAVGDDSFGEKLRQNLDLAHCDSAGIDVLQGAATGTATILVEQETGQNRILVAAGANAKLSSPTAETSLGDLVLAQLECPVQTIFAYLKVAHEQGARVILNPSPATDVPRDVLGYVDFLVVNESEASLISGKQLHGPFEDDTQLIEAADILVAQGATCVIITLGAEGVFYKAGAGPLKGASARTKAKPTKVVDTTGAGDTFVGAFAVRMANAHHPQSINEQNASLFLAALQEAIDFGMDAASLTIQKEGAQDSIPTLADLPHWVERSKSWT